MPAPSAKAADTPEVAPTSDPAIRTIAMPADTNPHGDIFGGWLLCQMDLAGSTVATRRANGRVVTVAITAMTFHRPVLVGDEVSCFCNVERIGNTSIAINDRELGAAWDRRHADQGDGRALHLCPRRGRRTSATDCIPVGYVAAMERTEMRDCHAAELAIPDFAAAQSGLFTAPQIRRSLDPADPIPPCDSQTLRRWWV